MPTASRRKLALQGMVSQLQTITEGATYFRTLLPVNVTTRVKLIQTAQEGNSYVWVRSGLESINQSDISRGIIYEGSFEILLDAIVKDATGSTMVEELEDLLHDISLALGNNRTLGGAVANSDIARIEPPVYGVEEFFAMTTVHVVCEYDFEYGSSI